MAKANHMSIGNLSVNQTEARKNGAAMAMDENMWRVTTNARAIIPHVIRVAWGVITRKTPITVATPCPPLKPM